MQKKINVRNIDGTVERITDIIYFTCLPNAITHSGAQFAICARQHAFQLESIFVPRTVIAIST